MNVHKIKQSTGALELLFSWVSLGDETTRQGMRVHGLPRKAHTDIWFGWLSNRDLHGSWEKHILCTNPEGDCRNAQLLPSKGCTLCRVQQSSLIHEDLRNRSEVELACVSQAEGKNTGPEFRWFWVVCGSSWLTLDCFTFLGWLCLHMASVGIIIPPLSTLVVLTGV